MIKYSNFHTHSLYCDGKDLLEEIVLQAISLGCRQLGFSSHAPIPIENDWCMTTERETEYKNEILRLKDKYAGKIELLLGIETDYYSEIDLSDYDYVIRSVHYILKDGDYLSIDESEACQKRIVERYYNSDFMEYIRDYYALVGQSLKSARCDIIGHFDLITKFNEGNKLFDTSADKYRKIVFNALDSIFESTRDNVVFEYNTGAISRGYRTGGYPESFILDYLADKYSGRYSFVINSDAHSMKNLLFGFEDAERVLLDHGASIRYAFPFKN